MLEYAKPGKHRVNEMGLAAGKTDVAHRTVSLLKMSFAGATPGQRRKSNRRIPPWKGLVTLFFPFKQLNCGSGVGKMSSDQENGIV